MSISFFDVVKPSFEIDFWMRHFRNMDYYECRAYEEYIMQPVHDDLYFADQIDPDEVYGAEENFGYDFILTIKETDCDDIHDKCNKEYAIPETTVVSDESDNYIYLEDEEE